MSPLVEFAYNFARTLGSEHTLFEADFGFALEEPPNILFNMRPLSPMLKYMNEYCH
jgi:hypothetical protein